MSTARAAALLGVIHALVDAACVLAVWRTGASTVVQVLSSFWIVFGYDLLAFATQAPLGVLADRRGLVRAALFAGLGLGSLALLLAPYSAIATMVAAGLGNALFHLGAGALVLRGSGGRATEAGLFVAPGALGLGLGMWMGKTGIGPTWPLVAALVLAVALVDALSLRGTTEAPARPDLPRAAWAAALGALLLSVAIRSFVGFGGCRECPKALLVTIGIPLVAFGGKLLGGVVSDRLGWLETSVGALLLSAPFVAFNGGNPYLALLGLLLFQMTMPVTLVAVFRLMPERPAAAFGLPCLALVLGAIPTFFPAGRQFFGAATFFALIAASAACIAFALRLIAVPAAPPAPCPQPPATPDSGVLP